MLSVFFDPEKAQDSTWKHHILSCIRNISIDGNMGVFASNFLVSPAFKVREGDSTSESLNQEEGVPQGGVMSTTLFIISINGIISAIPQGVRTSLYIDDLAVYAGGSNMKELRSLIQSAVDQVSAWATTNGFRFSTIKTCAMTFSRSRNIPQPPLKLYDRDIP